MTACLSTGGRPRGDADAPEPVSLTGAVSASGCVCGENSVAAREDWDQENPHIRPLQWSSARQNFA
eukprot:CAMPEP_0195003936 /NCGR_PEP_ID=MMETSP0326_2-20130528/3855_1 /TAXON_ID=2866 ORGANISM="Crypthecodinium cohnii, Strain Seligo" /NCGR_SAMPLE_ID=MMETSP0326_2 /ASSEMBLY_ACC=CAM_ASM_000348 /LENGTH=65 /DNA_ID=CAMNT_0040008433 /DNA_START=391 /DNA_END=584 /DNA_ORIENTATION=+